MPPVPVYTQKYRLEWEKMPELKDWILPSKNPTQALCRFCKCLIVCRLGDLKRHAQRLKHKRAAEPFSSNRQTKINFPAKENKQQSRAEGTLALFCAVHTSINVIDHLGECTNKTFGDSKATPVHIHRTKATGVINNVLGPHFKEELKNAIGDGYYSLLVDETTDIAIIKLLGVVIKYYDKTSEKFQSSYLGLVQIEDGTSQSIVNALIQLLREFDLNISKLIGLGTDNASTMIGINNGVYAILKREFNLTNLVLVRCVCHSLQLALSSATEDTIPRSLDYLIKETYNWFAHSTNKRIAYQRVYELINDGKLPLALLQMSKTRWISIESALKRIIEQYLELKTHFGIVRQKEHCLVAESLYSMYSDPHTLVYLKFLYPIVEEVQKVNKNFESSQADPTKLYQDLINLINSVAKRIITPRRFQNMDILNTEHFEDYLDPNPYMGHNFETACQENGIIEDNKNIMKTRCQKFLVKLLRELKLRLPSNLNIFKMINLISVHESLKPSRGNITELAKQYFEDTNAICRIEIQWNNLTNIKWMSVTNTYEFWAEVNKYRDASGNNPFEDLVMLAKMLLTLPHSNAEVERLFSQVNLIKTKLRNKISLNTLNNILLVRFGLRRVENCCHSYVIPEDVVKKIGTMETYNKNEVVNEVEVIAALTNGLDDLNAQ